MCCLGPLDTDLKSLSEMRILFTPNLDVNQIQKLLARISKVVPAEEKVIRNQVLFEFLHDCNVIFHVNNKWDSQAVAKLNHHALYMRT